MAETVVDLLEVVYVDHRQVLPGGCLMQLLLRFGHERAAVGDFGQGVDVGLLQQYLGQVKVVQLGLADLQVAVADQAAEKHRVADQHGAFDRVGLHAGVVERAEHHPGDGHGAEE
ncbi:hypothetical protein D3C81_1613530 [compost metagenome]